MAIALNTGSHEAIGSLLGVVCGRRLTRRLFLAAAVLVGTTQFDRAVAGDYILTEGDGLAVCEAYRRNFEPRHDVEPMACVRQYDSTIPGFASVPWRKLEINKKFELYREAEIDLATNVGTGQGTVVSEKDAIQMAKHLRGKAEHLQVELYVARLTLFGKSHPVNVLSVRESACGIIPKSDVKISRLFVLNDSLTHIDRQLQERLEGWNNNATIELYEGDPYIESYVADDTWATLLTGSGSLSVAKYTSGGFTPVCRIEFRPSIENGR